MNAKTCTTAQELVQEVDIDLYKPFFIVGYLSVCYAMHKYQLFEKRHHIRNGDSITITV